MKHLTHEQLCELVDDRLSGEDRSAAERHLTTCEECSVRLTDLRSLLGEAGRIPRALAPDEDLWPGIMEQIDRRKIVPLPAGSLGPRTPAWWKSVVAAAAAVALVVVTSLVTVFAVERRGSNRVVQATPVAAPANVAALVSSYESATQELMRSFEEQRSRLSPEVIQRIERNLRIIDDAVTETLVMLADDQNNETLVQLLEAAYRQKIAVLEIAAEATS